MAVCRVQRSRHYTSSYTQHCCCMQTGERREEILRPRQAAEAAYVGGVQHPQRRTEGWSVINRMECTQSAQASYSLVLDTPKRTPRRDTQNRERHQRDEYRPQPFKAMGAVSVAASRTRRFLFSVGSARARKHARRHAHKTKGRCSPGPCRIPSGCTPSESSLLVPRSRSRAVESAPTGRSRETTTRSSARRR